MCVHCYFPYISASQAKASGEPSPAMADQMQVAGRCQRFDDNARQSSGGLWNRGLGASWSDSPMVRQTSSLKDEGQHGKTDMYTQRIRYGEEYEPSRFSGREMPRNTMKRPSAGNTKLIGFWDKKLRIDQEQEVMAKTRIEDATSHSTAIDQPSKLVYSDESRQGDRKLVRSPGGRLYRPMNVSTSFIPVRESDGRVESGPYDDSKINAAYLEKSVPDLRSRERSVHNIAPRFRSEEDDSWNRSSLSKETVSKMLTYSDDQLPVSHDNKYKFDPFTGERLAPESPKEAKFNFDPYTGKRLRDDSDDEKGYDENDELSGALISSLLGKNSTKKTDTPSKKGSAKKSGSGKKSVETPEHVQERKRLKDLAFKKFASMKTMLEKSYSDSDVTRMQQQLAMINR